MLWWGYVHKDGSYHVKRFFDKEDLKDAEISPFVEQVIQPFDAQDREDALKKLKEKVE